jgi:asparagine synthase (glutamine-hydrolysing)
MTDTLLRRGPDDSGFWFDEAQGLGFGHRRLSIQDLSPEGRQPMPSASGRYVICFNGEVYNFAAIRAELARTHTGPALYRGGSDTEVMLAAIEAWGLEAAVQRFVGMFAFALWDRSDGSLSLVRDRVGVKPLCYARAGQAVVFASELRALLPLPNFSREIDHDAFLDYAAVGCVRGTRSIFGDARKVAPGTILRFVSPTSAGIERRYWDAAEHMRSALAEPFGQGHQEAEEQLHALLKQAVELRLVSDVPLGSFLSGGVDSSLVTALMQQASSRPVKTFCVGTGSADHDESSFAAVVAKHLGTEHSTLNVASEEAYSGIRELPATYDEPFADSSQLPMYLVSRFARQQVTVALSGDGGDEVFAGYNRHVWLSKAWATASLFASPLRASFAAALERPIASWLERSPESLRKRLPVRLPGDKARKVARLLRAPDFYAAYQSVCRLGEAVVEDERAPAQLARLGERTAELMLWDTLGYLPDDILTKVDRASMAVSLEAREPLLDHRVIEFAWRLPLAMKVSRGRGKRILRDVLARYLPRTLFERPKSGFSVPIGAWIRGPLRPWVEDRLQRTRDARFFDPKRVQALWARHLAGSTDAGAVIWSVAVFEAWREANEAR